MSRKTIYLEDAIDAICKACSMETDYHKCDGYQEDSTWCDYLVALRDLPSAQPESCEYYALCRHGRDENKLRAHLKFCEYCHEDSNGYVKPIEKNNHAFVRFDMDGWELSLKANGWHGSAKIRYCPMCGRRLTDG